MGIRWLKGRFDVGVSVDVCVVDDDDGVDGIDGKIWKIWKWELHWYWSYLCICIHRSRWLS
jgi:hypothetical protein